MSSLAEPRPVKWQGLNVSRRPTDGQQSPNPGEEALQQGAEFLQRPAVVLMQLYHETCLHVLPELHIHKGSFNVSVQVLHLKLNEYILIKGD